MGVPRLFPWLVKTFPKAHRHFNPDIVDTKTIFNIDGLYLDANGLLHSAAQIVFNYGDGKRKIDPNSHLTYDQKIKKLYFTFFEMIKTVTKIVSPKKVLYIAIDGPAPLAKQAQQRQRRFVSALSTDDQHVHEKWESTSITPGTIFMFELTKYMNYSIRKEVSKLNGNGWAHLEVFFSPPNVPGEGEHKIMEYLRNIRDSPNFLEKDKHCMFGPDGDLIMLTLAAHIKNIYLFRSDQYQPGYYDFLDMGMIRNLLPVTLKQNLTTTPGRNSNDIINDFILLGFFVGNDFLPKLQMFTYLEDGLALVLDLYSKMKNSFITLNNDIDFSTSSFKKIVSDMARRESWYLQDQAKMPVIDPRFKDTTLLKNILNDSGKITLDFPSFRKDYYAKSKIDIVGSIGDPSPEVRGMCIEYLKSIKWVFRYYVVSIPSWSYYYARYYAPLMVDLSYTLDTLTSDELNDIDTFDMGEPSVPFVQLLSIIAPKNATLLPKPFHELMTSPSSPLVLAGYYPKSFDIDYEGKTKEHMGVALLPFIDVDEVRKWYTPIARGLKNKYVRNGKGVLKKFMYDQRYTSTYVSDYGILKNINVRKIDM